jgi:hypothetical protein
MSYFIDLFSPETYEAFSRSDRSVSGFRMRQRNVAERIGPGDNFACYMTKASRWIGMLEVLSKPFIDDGPIFYPQNDPFVVRFKVRPVIWLERDLTIPIHEPSVWQGLSFTKDLERGSLGWTAMVRGSLRQLKEADGRLLEQLMRRQEAAGTRYPIEDAQFKKWTAHQVRRLDKIVSVSVPETEDEEQSHPSPHPDDIAEPRESIAVQALLADLGAAMGMRVWIPRSDRTRVEAAMSNDGTSLLDNLPLNYDDTTLKTIEQIDVLWLKGRSIVRAFEVEHTTSVYSGILRMADLLALQPNMDIQLHIVAPSERRDKVFTEIRRPVFSLLDRGPLAESCTFLSYDSVRELAMQPHLGHMSATVLDEYAEEAE